MRPGRQTDWRQNCTNVCKGKSPGTPSVDYGTWVEVTRVSGGVLSPETEAGGDFGLVFMTALRGLERGLLKGLFLIFCQVMAWT